MTTETKPTYAELTADLAHHTGSESYFRHWIGGGVFTEGVNAMARKAGAFWLIDAVFSHRRTVAKAAAQDDRLESFQVWTLIVHTEPVRGKMAVLECRADSDAPAVVHQLIEYTDFPPTVNEAGDVEPFKLYAALTEDEAGKQFWVLMLPSEY